MGAVFVLSRYRHALCQPTLVRFRLLISRLSTMAHRRTDSQRHLPPPLDMAPPSKAALPLLPVVYQALDSPSRSASSSSLPSIADIIHPRKSRQRTTFVALFALIILSVYVFLVAQPALSPIPLHNADDDSTPWRHMANSYIEKNKHRLSGAPSRPPQISLDPAQELAALTSFMAALPQNVIPSSVDPSLPIDPQLVLDFDTRSPRAESEIQEVVIDAWMRNPVVLFSKVCPDRKSSSAPRPHPQPSFSRSTPLFQER